MMIIPNVFILGPSRSGTSSVACTLGNHSEVCLAKGKEPLFFNTSEYFHGLNYNSEKYYCDCGDKSIIIDASTLHLMIPYVPERIYKSCDMLMPKFIIMARNPIERAYSHWWLHRNMSPGYARPTFEMAMNHNLTSFSYHKFQYESERMISFNGIYESYTPSYIEQGLLWNGIDRYRRFFSDNQILVMDFEDLRANTKNFYAKIWEFLELSPEIETTITTRRRSRYQKMEIATGNVLREKYKVVNEITKEHWKPDAIALSEYTGVDYASKWGLK